MCGLSDSSTFEVNELTIKECRVYPTLLSTVKKYLPELTDEQCAKVVSLVVGTCRYCYAYDSSCRCWNDE